MKLFRHSPLLALIIFVPLCGSAGLIAFLLHEDYHQLSFVTGVALFGLIIALFRKNYATTADVQKIHALPFILRQLLLLLLISSLLISCNFLGNLTKPLPHSDKLFLFCASMLPWLLSTLSMFGLNQLKAPKGQAFIELKEIIFRKNIVHAILKQGTGMFVRQSISIFYLMLVVLPIITLINIFFPHSFNLLIQPVNSAAISFCLMVLLISQTSLWSNITFYFFKNHLQIHRAMIFLLLCLFLLFLILTPILNWLIHGIFFKVNNLFSPTHSIAWTMLIYWVFCLSAVPFIIHVLRPLIKNNTYKTLFAMLFIPAIFNAVLLLIPFNFLPLSKVTTAIYLLITLLITLVFLIKDQNASVFLKQIFYDDSYDKKTKMAHTLYHGILQFLLISLLIYFCFGLTGFGIYVFAFNFPLVIFYLLLMLWVIFQGLFSKRIS